MANTTIALRSSGVASNQPSLGALANGELALNYADGILYYKSSSNTLGSIRTTSVAGLTTEVQFNDAGSFGSNASLTFTKSTGLLSSNSVTTNTSVIKNLTAGAILITNASNTVVSLANTGTAGTYGNAAYVPVISTDAYGRVSGVTNTAIAINATAVTGIHTFAQGGTNAASYTTGQVLTSNGTAFVSLANTGTAGTYANAAYVPVITTDAYGRVSAVTNTLIQISTTQVTSGILPFAQGGTNAASYTTGNLVISNGTSLVSLANTGTAGTYGNTTYVPVITTDAYGRVTSVSNVAIAVANTTVTDDTFTGTGSTTIYTMAAAATQNTVLVAINGILQPNTAYTIVNSNTTITLTEAPGLNDTVNIKRITGSGTSGGGGGSSTTLTTSNTTLTATSNGTTLVVGNFASTGDAIQKQYLVRNTTTNATESELMIDVSNRISVNTNTTVFFTADIVARRTDAINESASFFLKGAADNFSGTVAAVGSLYEVIVARDDASYLVDVRANNTTKTLNIYVTGVAGKTIRWVGNINTVEVAQ